jgi:hypothetical protein
MTTPQTQILDVIGARLANITIANGYSVTVQKLERARIKPFKNGDLPFINYYFIGDELANTLNTQFEERSLSCVIEFYDITRDKIFSDVASELMMDVKIAIDRDTAAPLVSDLPSFKLGGLVSKLECSSMSPVIGDGQSPYCGSIINLSTNYKVKRDTPFTILDY